MTKCQYRSTFRNDARPTRRTFLLGASGLVICTSCAPSGRAFGQDIAPDDAVATRLDGSNIRIFNGIPNPEGWGEDLVYESSSIRRDDRLIGPYGGLPIVDVWTEDGGVAVFNTTHYQEPFSVSLERDNDGISITASGGSNIEFFRHTGDYFEAVREFALRMKAKGLSVQPAPRWAFDANWETYGFEEDFDRDTIIRMLPTLKSLGIKTITIDSGWYGEGRGEDIEFRTGDFPVNPDTVGSEQDWIDFIALLKAEGFRVRLWWVPGVAEEDTIIARNNPHWLTDDVLSSTDDTSDIYLDPQNPDVVTWNTALVERLVRYGIDGFKQDDIYNYLGTSPAEQQSYAALINGNLEIAQSINADFAVNSCNCGLAQNFYMMPGQNQLITSDPVGSKQFRARAKYLHALNVNGAAILSDHVELSQGDVGPDDMDQPGFYDAVDFSSIVPLGMVLQTKFRQDPGAHYVRWFSIYNQYRFFDMTWVNVPKVSGRLETYLLKDARSNYYSFFTDEDDADFEGPVHFVNLSADQSYDVFNIVSQRSLGTFTASGTVSTFNVSFSHSVTLQVTPV